MYGELIGIRKIKVCFTAAFIDISFFFFCLFWLRSQGERSKLIRKWLVLELASNNSNFLFIPCRCLTPWSRCLYSDDRLPPPKSLSCPPMLNSSRFSGLVHTKVGKLHLVDGYRSTLGLAVTWRNGSRWAGRGSEWKEETVSIIIIFFIIHAVSITAINVTININTILLQTFQSAVSYLIVISKIWFSLLCSSVA